MTSLKMPGPHMCTHRRPQTAIQSSVVAVQQQAQTTTPTLCTESQTEHIIYKSRDDGSPGPNSLPLVLFKANQSTWAQMLTLVYSQDRSDPRITVRGQCTSHI